MRIPIACATLAAIVAILSAADSTDKVPLIREGHFGGAAPAGKALRVMTWNIDSGARLDEISKAMRAKPADLCLLQEVDQGTKRAQNRDIAEELGRQLQLSYVFGLEWREFGQETGGPAYQGQATLTNLRVMKSRVIRFQRQSDFWKPRAGVPSSWPIMQRRDGGRIALVTELEFAGQPLVVYNVHLESRSMGFIQYAQLEEIFADAKQYPAAATILIAGDLNSKYRPSIFLRRMEREGFQSCWGDRIRRTHLVYGSLDWIFARGPLKLSDGEVARETTGSDHFPVYARLSQK